MSSKKSKKSKKQHGSKKDKIKKEDAHKMSELTKETLTIEIKNWEEKALRYKKECAEVEASSQQWKREYTQLNEDKQEIVSYLRRLLDTQRYEVTELQERLAGLRLTRQAEADEHKKQVAQMKAEFHEATDQLTAENMILGGKLASLEEFKAQKDEILAKFESMQAKVKEQEHHHKEVVYKMEQKSVLEKDRLKKEMTQMLEEIAANFRNISKMQMAETTRRALQENARLHLQTMKLREQLEGLHNENKTLKKSEEELKLSLQLMQEDEKQMTRKNVVLIRRVNDLTVERQQLEEKVKALESVERSHRTEKEFEQLINEVHEGEEKERKLHDQLTQCEKNYSSITDKLQKSEEENQNMENILFEAGMAIQNGLAVNVSNDDPSESRAKRTQMLTHLLHILNRSQTKRYSSSKLKDASRYFPGHLGLVPQENPYDNRNQLVEKHHMSTQTERMEVLPHFPPIISNAVRASSAVAAYRILHDVGVSTRAFIRPKAT